MAGFKFSKECFRTLSEYFFRFVLWIFLAPRYQLTVIDREKLPIDGPAFIVSNHESYLDGLIVALVSRKWARFLVDWIYYRLPVFKQICRWIRAIPIAPQKVNQEVLKRAYETISESLANGEVIAIFPEGWVTRDGGVAPFKRGIEKMLERNPAPVTPVAITGLWGSVFSREGGKVFLKRPKYLMRRRKVTIRVGDSIPPDKASAEHLRETIEKLKKSA